jgi:hypothetical protein
MYRQQVHRRIEIITRHLHPLPTVSTHEKFQFASLSLQPTTSHETKGLLAGQVAIITGSGILNSHYFLHCIEQRYFLFQ